MKKGKTRLSWTGIKLIVFTVSICLTATGIFGAKGPSESAAQKRADIIRIDAMQAFGKLERPPVTFLHQKHTEALAAQNKDCSACHLVENNRSGPKFMRLKNTAKQEVMDIYHANCVACHQETAAAGQKSGPVVCGECHKDRPDLVSIWQPIGMDRSLPKCQRACPPSSREPAPGSCRQRFRGGRRPRSSGRSTWASG